MKSSSATVIAENNQKRGGFDIYLYFSGQREYLMWHRHNGLLYGLLKDGIKVSDIQRTAKTQRTYSGMLRYLLTVINEYIAERECYA